MAALSVAVVLALSIEQAGELIKDQWIHPYPYQVFAFIVGFAVTYRCNYSYNRYMEAATNLRTLSDKLCEAAIAFSNYDAAGVTSESAHLRQTHGHFQAQLLHLISLAHAVALQQLRCDEDIGNLLPHDSSSRPPPVDAAGVFTNAHVEQSCQRRRFTSAECAKQARYSTGVWSLLKRAVVMSTSRASQDSYNWLSPLPVLGGILPEERALLELEPMHHPRSPYVTAGALCMPAEATRFYVVFSWLQKLIQQRLKEGGLGMPFPILARAYQLLSDALTGFSQAKKIAETPFPFPWAQTIFLLLLLLTVTVPLMVCAYIKALWLQILVTVLGVSTYWALNEVARDLEDPFIYHPNDLPLAYNQHYLNQAMQAAAFGRMPNLKAVHWEPQSHLRSANGSSEAAAHAGSESASLSQPLLGVSN